MSYTLGVDIGTYESKGVLVDGDGKIVAQAARKHKMLVPQAGWAEHDPDQDWWGDFVHLTSELLATSRVDPQSIKAIGCSAIGPCMLPVDSSGNALMNGVLYGVDTRAHSEIEDLNNEIGEETILNTCGNALSAQSVGPKILWLKRNRPEIFAKTESIHTSTTYLVFKLTGRAVIDQYNGCQHFAALRRGKTVLDLGADRRHCPNWANFPGSCGLPKLPERLRLARPRKPVWLPEHRC